MPQIADSVIFSKVVRVVSQTFALRPGTYLPSTRLADDLSIGRLGRWTLIIALEDRFDIEFPNDIAKRFQTLGDIVSYMRHHLDFSGR